MLSPFSLNIQTLFDFVWLLLRLPWCILIVNDDIDSYVPCQDVAVFCAKTRLSGLEPIDYLSRMQRCY